MTATATQLANDFLIHVGTPLRSGQVPGTVHVECRFCDFAVVVPGGGGRTGEPWVMVGTLLGAVSASGHVPAQGVCHS